MHGHSLKFSIFLECFEDLSLVMYWLDCLLASRLENGCVIIMSGLNITTCHMTFYNQIVECPTIG